MNKQYKKKIAISVDQDRYDLTKKLAEKYGWSISFILDSMLRDFLNTFKDEFPGDKIKDKQEKNTFIHYLQWLKMKEDSK